MLSRSRLPAPACAPTRRRETGVLLIEALIGILLFMIGVLGLIGLQATTIATAADAQYRGEAEALAAQLITQMWLNADRSSTANLATSVNSFRYNTTTGSTCSFSGGAADSTNTTLSNWVTSVTSGSGTFLPGATTAMQQVLVNTASNNLVTVTVCWKAPKDPVARSHTVLANIS